MFVYCGFSRFFTIALEEESKKKLLLLLCLVNNTWLKLQHFKKLVPFRRYLDTAKLYWHMIINIIFSLLEEFLTSSNLTHIARLRE